MVGAGHDAYTDRFHELSRLVPHLVTPKNKRIERYVYGFAPQIRAMAVTTKPTTIQSVVQKVRMLTDEAIRNGALKKVTEKRGNSKVPSKDGKSRDDNKRPKTGRAFATVTNSVRKEYTGLQVGPRLVTPVNAKNLTATFGVCFKCAGTYHYKASCPRLNRTPRPGGNRPNQVMAIEGHQGRGKNDNQARRGAFMMGAKEARQDPNIVTGTFTLNNHYATTLFDFGADYSFVSTTFIPLLGIEPSDLGMDWLIRYEAEIVCQENVVRITLLHDELLRVLRENPEEKARYLMSAKTEEQKLKDIIVVRNFPELFPDELSGLPPS
ncbi:hypothetical protein Tco_1382598 [Tanacetum coccineum]